MPIAKKSLIARCLISAVLVVAASASAEAQPSPLPSQDVVVLVDCSESATPYLRAVNGILSRFAGGARRGDSLTCYQFSNTPVLIARMRLDKTGDVSQLRAQLDLLQTGGELTSFAPALRRAMADIVASHSARPTNERVLLLITDGRRHPKDTKSEKKAFNQLLKEYSRLKAGRDYSFYSFYIGDWYESDLQEYLLSAGAHLANWPKDVQWLERLTIADIRIMDRTASLEDMPDVPSQGVFSIAFYPRRPPSGLAMLELDTRATFLEATLDRFFTADPRRFICRQEPWSEKFFMETRGFARGAYHGTFHFTPSEPRALLLHPRDVDFSLTILGV